MTTSSTASWQMRWAWAKPFRHYTASHPALQLVFATQHWSRPSQLESQQHSSTALTHVHPSVQQQLLHAVQQHSWKFPSFHAQPRHICMTLSMPHELPAGLKLKADCFETTNLVLHVPCRSELEKRSSTCWSSFAKTPVQKVSGAALSYLSETTTGVFTHTAGSADHCLGGISGARAQASRALHGGGALLSHCKLGAGVPSLGAVTEAGVIQRLCRHPSSSLHPAGWFVMKGS